MEQKTLDRLTAVAAQLIQSATVRAEPWPNGARLTVDWVGLDKVHFLIDVAYAEGNADDLRNYLRTRFRIAVTARAVDRWLNDNLTS